MSEGVDRDAVRDGAGTAGAGDARGWAAIVVFLCAALLLHAEAPAPLAAQEVTGTVLEAGAEAPLPGVLVSLLDSEGRRVAATLTDEDGGFSLEAGTFGRFRLRAVRIGLETTTSRGFDLFTTDPRHERILMGQRAIQIDGLVVDSRVEQCRIDPGEAVRIQRWWQEVRTALNVSRVVQDQGLALFQVVQYERAMDEDLERTLSITRHHQVGAASTPFASVEADALAERGYVQGALGEQRSYFAPDADVLLSDSFLSGHCFRVTSHDDEAVLGLTFEPTSERVPDIRGTLWVDTTTAELQSLDFRYVNVQGEPANESGGSIAFDYLPSGAWIVRDWYIRMPTLAQDAWTGRLELAGYVDVGGEATPLDVPAPEIREGAAMGAVRGVVRDSIRGRPLPGATVWVFGSTPSAVTDAAGEFVLSAVPEGEHRVTFTHPDLRAWRLGSPAVSVDVRPGRTSNIIMAVPGFRTVAAAICQGSGLRAEAVLIVEMVDASERVMGGVPVVLSWMEPDGEEPPRPVRRELRTDGDGRAVACLLPTGRELTVDARIDGALVRGFEIILREGGVEFRRVQFPL